MRLIKDSTDFSRLVVDADVRDQAQQIDALCIQWLLGCADEYRSEAAKDMLAHIAKELEIDDA